MSGFQNDGDEVPAAPYPPMNARSPHRSVMSSSPYTSLYRDASNPKVSRSQSASERNLGDNLSDLEIENLTVSRQNTSDAQKTNRPFPLYSPQLKFMAGFDGTFACINVPTTNSQSVDSPVAINESNTRNRKVGPVLLELRRLAVASDSSAWDQLFETRTLAVSRGNPQLGTSVASTCLDLPVVENYNGGGSLVAATGLTTGMLAVHTFTKESADDKTDYFSSVEYFHASRHHRQASAVAWRPSQGNHVAIGLVGSGSAAAQQGNIPRRGAASVRGASGDREFCCFLWDIETQQLGPKRSAAPVSKLSHNTPVASLAWVLNGQTLAVGTQARNIQLYDMRSGTNAPPLSALAHTFGVHGIETDPHNPHVIATFSRSAGEPVKLWDVRRMDSALNEIKVANTSRLSQLQGASQSQSLSTVQVIKWSKTDVGVLSVAIGDCVQDFDTSSSSRPALIRDHQVPNGVAIKDMALGGLPVEFRKEESQSGKKPEDLIPGLVKALYSRRVLLVTDDFQVLDMSKDNGATPVAISKRDGRIIHTTGSTFFTTSTTAGPSAIEVPSVTFDEDISATMMRRARCLRSPRYSMNTSNNIKALAEEIKVLSGLNGTLKSDMFLSITSLLRLWSWIERIEALSTEFEEGESDSQWFGRGLLNSGTVELLRSTEDGTDQTVFSEALSCNVYDSPERRLALGACGWAGEFDLNSLLLECERIGDFERSAALAVWHGEIGKAVESLQHASAAVRSHLAGKDVFGYAFISSQYAETLDLIAMCVAGFSAAASAKSDVWRQACSTLLQRDDLSDSSSKTTRTVYLRALCQFLMDVTQESRFESILENTMLSVGDRVAFACRFLNREELDAYLGKCLDTCRQLGNVEGLVITGLSQDGIKILQAFVDRTSDVQTVALVASRVVIPATWSERRTCMEWIEAYRTLLNTWQMWQSRAMFDVDRADLIRAIKARSAEPGSIRRMPMRRQGSRNHDPDILVAIPAGLDARCNYCASSFSSKYHEGNTNQWLSKMKPILSCCPQCRKPLPRCAICSLSLGLPNPYLELAKDRSRTGNRGNGTAKPSDDPVALPLDDWFTWCMTCKHGGHARCLVGWFEKHEMCPVSGCECRCQFDGRKKLTRPALKQEPEALQAKNYDLP